MSHLLDSDHAKGWITNPVETVKKGDPNQILVNLDITHMKQVVRTVHFPIPTVAELRRKFEGSDWCSVLDLNYAFRSASWK